MTTQKLLTRKQVASFFGVSIRTLERWRKQGIIDAIKINGTIRFSQDEIDRVLRDNRVHIRQPKVAHF